jgi:hypothetical protein
MKNKTIAIAHLTNVVTNIPFQSNVSHRIQIYHINYSTSFADQQNIKSPTLSYRQENFVTYLLSRTLNNFEIGTKCACVRSLFRAYSLPLFFWGLLILTTGKEITTVMSYLDARLLVSFSWSLLLWRQGTCFYIWLWYKIERTSKPSAIWFILRGYVLIIFLVLVS